MMLFTNRSARRWLVIGVACLFGFARVAFATAPCSLGAAGCLPAISVAAHGQEHEHGQACTMQAVSSQAVSAATSGADVSDAVIPVFAAGLAVATPPKILRPWRIAIAPAAPSRLAVSARLRL